MKLAITNSTTALIYSVSEEIPPGPVILAIANTLIYYQRKCFLLFLSCVHPPTHTHTYTHTLLLIDFVRVLFKNTQLPNLCKLQ